MNKDRTGQVWEVGGNVYLVHESYQPVGELNILLHRVACISAHDNPLTLMAESTRTPWERSPTVHRRIV